MTRTVALLTVLTLATSVVAQDVATGEPSVAAQGTAAIAAWDVVPYQVIDTPFTVGVVAFHETGCRVDFAVVQPPTETGASDGAVTQREHVKQATLNERTGVWEYHINIDPTGLEDGPFAVLATAVPMGEGCASSPLAPLPLLANANGSLNPEKPVWADCDQGDDETGDGSEARPLKTIRQALENADDGGTVYLKAGKNYSSNRLGGGKTRTYWTTIAAAPGVKREDVEIGPGRPGCEKLRFKSVTLYSDPPNRKYNTILSGENGSTIVWLDDCRMYNRKGRWDGGGVVFGNRYVAYVTGGITTEMDNGPGALLLRNHKIHKITSDALTSARTAINCEVRDIDRGPTDAHPDWHQSYTGGGDKYKTCILYNCSGVNCISQGFFGHNLKDSAFVNCIFHRPPGIGYSQYSGHMDHVLWLHCTVPTQTWLWRGSLHGNDCYVQNGIFIDMHETQGGDTFGFSISHNHFIKQEKTMGTETTVGDPQFVAPEKLDFHVRPTSPAAYSAKPLQCVPADMDGKPRDPKRPTRGCYATADSS